MSHRYIGGLITKTPVTPTAQAAPGVWTLEQALQYIKAGTWPTPQNGDPYWQNTNLLLGTNGVNTSQNNTFLDSSNNTYSVTRSGNPTQGTFTPLSVPNGYWGNYFDGNGDYLTIADNVALRFGTGAFTIEAWIFPTVAAFGDIFSKGNYGGGSTPGYFEFRKTDTNALSFYSNNTGTLTTTNKLSLNQWSHVAVSRDGSTVRLFINGILSATNTDATAYDNTGTAAVGAASQSGYVNFFDGFISNLRVVKGTALYTSDFTPSTSPFTAISGTSLLTCQSNYFKDNSTNGFPISITGTPKVLPFAPFGNPSAYRANTVSGSGYFDGSGDLLTTGYTGFFGTGDYTISFWIYMDAYVSPDNNGADGGFVSIYNQGTSHPTYPLGVQISKAGKVVVVDSVNFGPTWESTFDFAGSYNTANSAKLGQWNYVHLYRQSGTLYIYCNGGLQLSVSQSSALAAPVTNGTIIPQGYCQGYLTDFRLVTSAITDPTPPTAPLTAVTNTQLLLNFTNAGLYDLAAKNDMETAGNAQVSTSVVKFGAGSAYFDGSGDYLLSPNKPFLNPFNGQNTLEMWVYPTSISSGGSNSSRYGTLFNQETPGSSISWGLGFNSSGQLVFSYWNGSASVQITSTVTISVNTWSHVGFVHINNSIALFVNGLLSSFTATTGTPDFNINNPTYIGLEGRTSGGELYYQGYIADIRFTSGLARYTYSFTPPTAAFPSYYQAITPLADPYFDYTTLLLPGNGTNGAQNNTFLDSSANTFSITRNGNTTQGTFSPFSQTGWSNYFDGSDDYLTLPASSSWLFNGDACLEVWVYWTASQASIFFATGNASSSDQFGLFPGGEGIWWGVTAQSSNIVPPLNQWSHICVTRQGSTIRRYLNGVLVTTDTNASAIGTNSSVAYVGRRPSGGVQLGGYISQLRVVNGSVPTSYQTSSTAIGAQIFTPPTTPLTTTSQGATANDVKLLLCQSNRFYDASSAANSVTAYNGVSVQAFSPFNPTASYSTSTVGGSGYFDGTGDYLALSSTSIDNFGTGDFTVEAWIYCTTVSTSNPVVVDQTTAQFAFGIAPSNYLYYGTSDTADILSSSTINGLQNSWRHIAISRTSGTSSLYLDGTRVATGSDSTNWSSGGLWIGRRASGAAFNGYISNVRVVKGTGLYSGATITVPTAPLTAITNTQLLLNFTNGGITDATAKNDLETVGNAQISTAQSKFGGSSMYFDGTGDRLQIPDSPGLRIGTGDFTIEGWFYTTTLSGVRSIFYKSQSDTNGVVFVINNSSAGSANLYAGTGSGSWSLLLDAPSAIAVNTWTHLAAVRYGNRWMIFSNGNLVGSATNSVSASNTTEPATIGYFRSANPFDWNGYMQDVRITKGIARYTQNFTPPATAFLTL